MKTYQEKYINIKKTGSGFHVRVLVPNRPTPLQRKQGGVPTIGQAKALAYEFRDALLLKRKRFKKGYSDFASAKTLYLHHKVSSLAPKTRDGAEKFFNKWTTHWDSKMLGEFETADIYNFKTQMEEKVAPATVVRNMGYIRGLFKHFMDLGEIDRNPCAAVKLPKVKRSKQAPAMTREEIIKVLDFTKKNKHPLYPFIFLAYQTGARSSELKELRISDFDLGNHTVTIARSLDPKEGIVPTKDGEPRTVPLNSATVEFVRQLIAGRNRSERLLPQYKPFYRGDGAKHLRQIQKDLGIEPNNFHSIRASFVTHLLMADVPMSVVQRLVGHSEPKTTDEYVRMSASDKKGATNALSVDCSALGVTDSNADFNTALLSL